MRCRCLWSPEMSDSFGAAVKGNYESPDSCGGSLTQILCKNSMQA